MAKVEVGQKLYQSKVLGEEPIELTVTKVGRVYFEVSGDYRGRYTISDLKRESEYTYGQTQLYLTAQEVMDKDERSSLYSKIREKVGIYGNNNLTLEQLRGVAKILELID